MAKYRMKPVEVEAVRLTKKTYVETRLGTMKGVPGEWLITTAAGEQYLCGDELFRATYEGVSDEVLPDQPSAQVPP